MYKMIGVYLWISSLIITVFGLSLQMETNNNIVRDPSGDLFSIISEDCYIGGCAKNGRYAKTVRATASQCRCQCSDSHPVMRDDMNECVNQLDCPLVTFIRPLLKEHIPVVSLPVSSGQLIHPGAHLTLAGVDKSLNHSEPLLCQIDNSNVMTQKGWQPISMSDGSHPFELYEDGNHTFLQWLATDSVRKSLRQKLVLIRLICSPIEPNVEISAFKPCIAIRIGWVPGLGVSTKRESPDPNKTINSQNTNFLMIGLCLGLLGIMYVSALMVYMRSKNIDQIEHKDRPTTHRWPSDSEESQITTNLTANDGSNNSNNEFRVNSSPENDSINIDIEVNMRSVPTDWTQDSSINNESLQDLQNNLEDKSNNENNNFDGINSELSDIQNPIYEKRLQKPDRIPRHSLRVSPELFEPQLLLDPPQRAIEMLQKIRDLITIAKSRLRNFRFRPTLVVIPEDDYFYIENLNNCFVSENTIKSDNEIIIISEGSSVDDSHQTSNGFDVTLTSSTDFNNDLTADRNIVFERIKNCCILSNSDQDINTTTRSFSRRKMLNDLQLPNTITINDLNYDQKNIISDKSIEVKNFENESEPIDEQHIYTDIRSLELLSTKAENVLRKNFEKQVLNEKQETPDKRIVSYFKNSLGRFASKSKPKSEQVLVSSNNWTLQTVGTGRNSRSRNLATKSMIRKKMITRKGQLCYNCSDVSSLSSHRLTDTDSEQKPSLESNENNESMDSFECCYSDSEMSTTSSTVRDNQLTSLESELNDDSNHSRFVDRDDNEEHSSIDECLKYLAAASVDTTAKNHDKYYQRIGRASKGMTALKQLKTSEWNHVCHRSDSELEMSEKKFESKTNFYSKNSKSRIKSSKSLNGSNRQKFKKKLALYRSHTNDVFNRTENQNSSETNCCSQTKIDECFNGLTNICVNNLNSDSVKNSIINTFEKSSVVCESNDNNSSHYVIKIRI